MSKVKGVTIPFETADAIALHSLIDHVGYLKSEVKDHLTKGSYLHPEDLAKSMQLIPALELIISYYGGDPNVR